jgi:antitoxin ParD1/3/4
MGENSFSPEIRKWIAGRVAEGHYADEEDYFLDLIRRDMQEVEDDIDWVRSKLAEAERSQPIDAEPEDVIEQIIAERRARRG